MTKCSLKYDDLVEKLEGLEVSINADDLRGRISRGNFSAALFVQCIKVMGIKNLPFDDSYFERKDKLENTITDPDNTIR